MRTGWEALREFGGDTVETYTRTGWLPVPAQYARATESDRTEMEGLDPIGLCTATSRSHGWLATQTIWDDIIFYKEDDSTAEEESEISRIVDPLYPEDEWPESGFTIQTEETE